MVERLLTDDVLLELPYLQRLRVQGQEEGCRQEAADILLR